MSFINDSLANAYSITNKITALQQGQAAADPQENFQLLVSQNFNDMLSSLLSSDDDEDKKSNDIFSSFMNNNNYSNQAANQNDQSAESLAMQAALLSNQAYAGII